MTLLPPSAASLAAVEPPCGGRITPIQRKESQLQHSVLHRLNPEERWDCLPSVPPDLRRGAQSAGCGDTVLAHEPCIKSACLSCREYLQLRYQTLYAPLYMADLGSAVQKGQWGHFNADARASDAFVGEHQALHP